ncbi:methyltransferase domain-containing protein [Streptomyces sp. NBC_00111]|uniref:class I SAM-dependent methyltransferase n=1 Tax=unclassified Streptomyces TaxID=2593676 RepID=UPI002E33B297|nr:methyltransferase domain-containing protein [Streptomyces sp. NBC_01460]
MTSESDTVETWNVYGAHQLARGLELTELDRWDWGIREVGPGIEALGDVNGLRVLDLGSGLGRHAAHLAARGADVTAADASPAQHQRALTRYRDAPGLHLVCSDAVTHLRDADPYDLIYSVGSVPYLDPDRLLKVPGAIRDGMTSCPGGRSIPLGGSPGSTSLVRGC